MGFSGLPVPERVENWRWRESPRRRGDGDVDVGKRDVLYGGNLAELGYRRVCVIDERQSQRSVYICVCVCVREA